MGFVIQPTIENPNLRQQIALIVDDPAPCINPLWYFRHQVDGQQTPAHERTIPLDFMESWCDWVGRAGIRGDFTVLPFPAGLGRVDQQLEGYDTGELRAWMDLARTRIALQFDIHCEILSHTRAVDLNSWTLLPPSEHGWMETQNEDSLAAYFAAAMRILQEADLPNHGLTQPCFYPGDESMYARAILRAEKQVNQRRVSHNFLHVDSVSHAVPPRITFLDRAAGEAIVSIWAGTDDYIWNAQERDRPEREMPPEALADRYVTVDGSGGRLTELRAAGAPMVLVTHWQSLHSNGSRRGLDTYREIVARADSLWRDVIRWRKLSEITDYVLASETASITGSADTAHIDLDVSSPFRCDDFTITVPTPWPLYRGPTVTLDGLPIPQILSATDLTAGHWLMRGSSVTVSLDLPAGDLHRLTITPLAE